MPIYSGKQKPLYWTAHAKAKMNFYRLSEQRVRRVLISPKRIETGIAPETIAMMQPVSVKWIRQPADGKRRDIWTQEIWVMVKQNAELSENEGAGKRGLRLAGGLLRPAEGGKVTKIISVWRYPGMTKPGEPLPDEILREIRQGI